MEAKPAAVVRDWELAEFHDGRPFLRGWPLKAGQFLEVPILGFDKAHAQALVCQSPNGQWFLRIYLGIGASQSDPGGQWFTAEAPLDDEVPVRWPFRDAPRADPCVVEMFRAEAARRRLMTSEQDGTERR